MSFQMSKLVAGAAVMAACFGAVMQPASARPLQSDGGQLMGQMSSPGMMSPGETTTPGAGNSGVTSPGTPTPGVTTPGSNAPTTTSPEGTPRLSVNEVQGRITSISGDQVQLRTNTGETRSYTISQADQQRNKLTVGSEVVLTVRNNAVIAVNPVNETQSGQSSAGMTQSTQSSSQMSQSSQTSPSGSQSQYGTTQQQPSQPVRGLW
jgi:hypothetical protein